MKHVLMIASFEIYLLVTEGVDVASKERYCLGCSIERKNNSLVVKDVFKTKGSTVFVFVQLTFKSRKIRF